MLSLTRYHRATLTWNGAATMDPWDGKAEAAPSAGQIVEWLKSLSNWGRWGPDDRRGTLNYVTPEKVVEAARLVRSGRTVTCSREIQAGHAPDNVHSPL